MRKESISRELTLEIVVGSFMVMVLLGLGYFTIILSRETWFTPKHQYEVVFRDVMGLREGDNVVVCGMTVGKVKMLELLEDGVHVVASLDAPVRMHEGYRVTIVTTSILGGRYLQIEEGPESAPRLPDGAVFRGAPPYDLMADAAELINAAKQAAVEGGIITNLQSMADQLHEIVSRVNAGEGTLGKLLSADDTLYRDLSEAVASAKTIASRLEAGEGTLGRLMSQDDAVYEDLAATLASLRSITARIESGEGLLGRLVQDDALYGEIEGVVGEVRATVDDLRETTPVVTFTSIFFGAF